jgi:putative endonuclease
MTEPIEDPSTGRRRLRETQGRRAEALAALWLQLKGYRILDRRARTPRGEIDLVAVRGKLLVFIEVKHRSKREAALEAVTPQLRDRIEDAARMWVSRRRKLAQKIWRFDIVAIAPGQLPWHVRDAWRART